MRTVLTDQAPLLRDPALASAALSSIIRHAAIHAFGKSVRRWNPGCWDAPPP
jgi:hypothetical protein